MNHATDKKEQIWSRIAAMNTPGFFITAEITQEGEAFPETLESYIKEKLESFRQGVEARKFAFREEGWRMYLTFFPTDRVVEERYALKNKAVKRRTK